MKGTRHNIYDINSTNLPLISHSAFCSVEMFLRVKENGRPHVQGLVDILIAAHNFLDKEKAFQTVEIYSQKSSFLRLPTRVRFPLATIVSQFENNIS